VIPPHNPLCHTTRKSTADRESIETMQNSLTPSQCQLYTSQTENPGGIPNRNTCYQAQKYSDQKSYKSKWNSIWGYEAMFTL